MRSIPALVLVLLVAVAAPAAAQQAPASAPDRPQGWWGSAGGGLAAIRFSCADCGESQPVYESPAMGVAFGKTLGNKVAFGVEFDGALMTTEAGAHVLASSFAGTARWYPSSTPFYLKFSIGLSRVRARITTDGEETSSLRNGTGISFGAGYDFKVGRSVAITPHAGWYMSAVGDIGDPASTSFRRDVSWNTWTIGVGVTFF